MHVYQRRIRYITVDQLVLDWDISIDDLCGHIGVSRRMLRKWDMHAYTEEQRDQEITDLLDEAYDDMIDAGLSLD